MPGCQFHFHGYYAASTSPAAITHSAMRKLRDRADATEARKRLIGGSWFMGTEDTAPSPFDQAECL